MQSPEQIASRLYSRVPGNVRLGLDRIREGARRCGNPQARYPTIHVAGTNGKGAVCVCLEALLRNLGFRTGLFIKPHLRRFEERFQINGCPVRAETWAAVYRTIEPVITTLDLTFFEAAVLIAFEVFRREKVEWAVIETGLGGRLDATNILTPRCVCITAVDMDHRDYLGNTLMEIATEKLGIVKPKTPVCMIEPPDTAVANLARQHCARHDAPLTFVNDAIAGGGSSTHQGVAFRYDGYPVCFPVPGRHQISNVVLALTALDTLFPGRNPARNPRVFDSVRFPGRFQVTEHDGKTLILDTAHNSGAVRALVATIREQFPGATLCVLIGMMADKDYRAVLAHCARCAARFILVKPRTPRAVEPSVMARVLEPVYQGAIHVCDSVESGVHEALALRCDVLCITGSFYTVGEAMETLNIEPYG